MKLNQRLFAFSYEPTAYIRHHYSPHFFQLSEKQTLRNVISKPHRVYLEVGPIEPIGAVFEFIQRHQPDFTLSVTTKTACEQPLSSIITQELNCRMGLNPQKSHAIETCLQEAIINAVVHGNLELSSNFNCLESFDKHLTEIEERLRSDIFKYKRVTIHAWHYNKQLQLCVSDQGRGYSREPSKLSTHEPYGRGLHIIESFCNLMWHEDLNRRLFMQFNYQ